MTPRATTKALSLGILAAGLVAASSACSSSNAEPPKAPTAKTTMTSSTQVLTANVTEDSQAEPGGVCDLVCERAEVVPRPADTPDYTELATANANRVLEGMQSEILACYAKRVAVNPKAHAFITVDIIINPDGTVRDVETTGGALLGPTMMSCIVNRVQRATFDPVRGGGTLRIHVPLTLRRLAPGEESI